MMDALLVRLGLPRMAEITAKDSSELLKIPAPEFA